MKTNQWMPAILGLFMALLATGCSIDVTRNADGSLQLDTRMEEADLQEEIALAIAEPRLDELTVDLQDGTIAVSGERSRAQSDDSDTITFELDLTAVDGHLAATVTNAQINGSPLDPERIENWNNRIADRLERFGQRRPNSSLESVTVTDDALLMSWRLDR